MSVKQLNEHHLEFLSLKGDCTGLSESTLSKCHIVGKHMSQLISDLSLHAYVQLLLLTLSQSLPDKTPF